MNKRISFHALKVSQPIGDFFIASIPAADLNAISYADVRRMANEEGEIDQYLGIQRKISPGRIAEIKRYISKSPDATFPSSIIVSVPEQCVTWDPDSKLMTISEYIDEDDHARSVKFAEIAKILDGQHRLRGLAEGTENLFLFEDEGARNFELNVALFIGADLAEQATIFSTVNLAQTKVNRSLVFDLAELSNSRSPQRSCHEIAVVLDSQDESPLHRSIKRLGVKTKGRDDDFEPITQATFVDGLLPYITTDAISDRQFLMVYPGRQLPAPTVRELSKMVFRGLFVEEREVDIAKIVWSYFAAIKERWPTAWVLSKEPGNMLRRTNGFRAFMRFLGPAYLAIVGKGNVGEFVPKSKFLELLQKVNIGDDQFVIAEFPPGTSGETKLYKRLLADTNVSPL